MNSKPSPGIKDYLILIFAIAGISFAAPLIKVCLDGGANVFATAFWRILLGSVFMAFLGKPWQIKASKKAWTAVVVGGILMALHFLTWISGIGLVNISVSVVLVTTTPIWVVVFDAIFYKQKPTKRILLGIGIAMIGAIIVALSGMSEGGTTWLGALLSVIAAMFAGLYMLQSRTAMEEMNSWETVSVIFPVAGAIILISALFAGQPLTGFSTNVWVAFGLMGILAQIMGHGGVIVSIKAFSATTSATAILFEPAGAAIIAWFMFGEVVPMFVYPGALLVIVGVWLTSTTK